MNAAVADDLAHELLMIARRSAEACIPCRGTGKLITKFEVFRSTKNLERIQKVPCGLATECKGCSDCAGVRAVIARAEQRL